MDKTWICYLTLESNQLSAEWTAAGESRPKLPKMQASAGKYFTSVFWDAQGILLIDYLEKRIIIKRINNTILLYSIIDTFEGRNP